MKKKASKIKYPEVGRVERALGGAGRRDGRMVDEETEMDVSWPKRRRRTAMLVLLVQET